MSDAVSVVEIKFNTNGFEWSQNLVEVIDVERAHIDVEFIKYIAGQIKKYEDEPIRSAVAQIIAALEYLQHEFDAYYVSRESLKKVCVEALKMKENTFRSALSQAKKAGYISLETIQHRGRFIDAVTSRVLRDIQYENYKEEYISKRASVDPRANRYISVRQDRESQQRRVGEYVAEIAAASDEKGGYLLVDLKELMDITAKYKVRLTLNVVQEIEKNATNHLDEFFKKVTLVNFDDVEVTDIADIAKKRLYDLVRVQGRVVAVNREDEQRIVFVRYYKSEYDKVEEYYDFVYDRSVPSVVKKKDERGEVVELKKDYVETVPLYKLKLVNDEGDKYVTIITYQDVKGVKLGDRVDVVGFVDQFAKRNKKDGQIKEGALIVRAYAVKKLSDFDIEFSEEQIAQFKEFARNNDVLEKLVDMLDVTEDQRLAAKAILLALISEKGFQDPSGKQIRKHLHVLMISDAGTGKSTLMRTFANTLRLDPPVNARAASAPGILGAVQKDEKFGWYVEAGLLPRNNRRMGVFIDELDKAEKSLIDALHSPFEEGVVIIEKAAKAAFPALTSIIAAANPVESLDEFKHVFEQVNVSKTLLDRFDFILALWEPAADVKRKIHEQIIDFMFSDIIKKENHDDLDRDRNFVRDYLYYVYYYHELKSIDDETMRLLLKFANTFDMLRAQNKQSKRLVPTLVRITRAVARIRLHEKVTKEDALEAIRLYIQTQATLLPEDEREEFSTFIEAAEDVEKLAELLGALDERNERAREELLKSMVVSELREIIEKEKQRGGVESIKLRTLAKKIALDLDTTEDFVLGVLQNLSEKTQSEMGIVVEDDEIQIIYDALPVRELDL